VEEVAQLRPFIGEWEAQGLDVVLVVSSADSRALDFFSERGWEVEAIVMDGRARGQVFGVSGIPHSFLIDKTGVLRSEDLGWDDGSLEETRAKIAELLAGK